MNSLPLMNVPNLLAYFQQEIQRLIQEMGHTTSAHAEAYVVHLLDEYTRISDTRRAQLGFERAAALMLHDASLQYGDQRIEAYRQLGDTCLYHCGLFEAQLTRRQLKAAYYRDMGKMAYLRLGDMMSRKRTDHVFGQIFQELSQTFDLFVTALQHLAASWHGESGQLAPALSLEEG